MNAELICTAKGTGQRFSRGTLESSRNVPDGGIRIELRPDERDQTVLGFGGAFTDTSAAALLQMDESLREEILKRYFDPVEGLGYNAGRVPIGACDFTRELYSFDDHENDTELEKFSVERDQKGIIPLIKAAREYMAVEEELYLYALPWSPPAWMKTNRDMLHGGHLEKKYYQQMASYIGKFVDAYQKNGISIRAVTSQNEPNEVQKWPSCEYSNEEEAEFLKSLIPEMKRRGVRILCWDSNKDLMRQRAEYLMRDPKICHDIDGVAFHWYSGGFYEELEKLHHKFPKLALCATECCVVMPEHMDEWSIGERYAHDMIQDFNHGTSLWLDWNLYLDEKSGPKFVENPCAAPIILDRDRQQAVCMSSYYYIGHLSRYIQRGAVRIGTAGNEESNIDVCSFENPDRTYCTVLMNREETKKSVSLCLGEEQLMLELLPHSIVTVLI